jgi:hypothetical protein
LQKVRKDTFLLVSVSDEKLFLKVKGKTEYPVDSKFFVFASGLIVSQKRAGTGNTI